MKTQKITAALFSALLAFAIHGRAQTMYQVTFKGTVQTTNSSGDIVSQKLSDTTYIDDAITALDTNETVTVTSNSRSNAAPSYHLVYVQNASTDPSATGDFIEVIEGTNNTPVYTNLQFMVGGNFPPGLTNASGTAYVAGAQVIPLPLAGTGDSLGGATIHERIVKTRTLISGSFNYISLRSPGSAYNDTIRVYSGTFNVGKPISP